MFFQGSQPVENYNTMVKIQHDLHNDPINKMRN